MSTVDGTVITILPAPTSMEVDLAWEKHKALCRERTAKRERESDAIFEDELSQSCFRPSKVDFRTREEAFVSKKELLRVLRKSCRKLPNSSFLEDEMFQLLQSEIEDHLKPTWLGPALPSLSIPPKRDEDAGSADEEDDEDSVLSPVYKEKSVEFDQGLAITFV